MPDCPIVICMMLTLKIQAFTSYCSMVTYLFVISFSLQLLPTDRPNWSNVDGTRERAREGVELASMAWAWDEEWHIDQVIIVIYIV